MKTFKTLGLCLALPCLVAVTAQAIPITGSISLLGVYAPQDELGVLQTDLNNASQIAFGPSVVTRGTGTFASIPAMTSVTMATPLVYSPATVPAGPLWSVTVNGDTFQFVLDALSWSGATGVIGAQTMTLSGRGMASYVGPGDYEATAGHWTGTFDANGASFAWHNVTRVPEGANTLVLLGSILSLLALTRRFDRNS